MSGQPTQRHRGAVNAYRVARQLGLGRVAALYRALRYLATGSTGRYRSPWRPARLSPELHLARDKRRLEHALRAAGVSRSQAARAVAFYFDDGQKADHGGH